MHRNSVKPLQMRGIDIMSASSKKKLRKEQANEVMTERQKKERSESKAEFQDRL
jgi:hypothetical protein